MTRRLRWLLAACLGATALLLLLASHGPESWLLVGLLRYGPPWVPLAPLLLALLLLVRARALCRALLLVAALCLGGAQSFSLRLAPSMPAAPRSSSWTLLSWNVEKYDRGVQGIAELIRAADADVLCLTEAGSYFWHTDAAHRPEALDASLVDYERIAVGEIRVYSRLPVLSTRVVPLEHGEAGRPLIDIEVATPAAVHALCMHAPPTYAWEHLRGRASGDWSSWAAQRRAHADEVTRHLPANLPMVLAGDFNCPERCGLWSSAGLHDAWTDVGRGFGASEATGQRVDRIMLSASMQSTHIEVLRTRASDHYALLATIPR